MVGDEGLWTTLRADGDITLTKGMLWWSTNYPGGGPEPKPEVLVTLERLDRPTDPALHYSEIFTKTTNAHTAKTGWMMVAGVLPPRDRTGAVILGCSPRSRRRTRARR